MPGRNDTAYLRKAAIVRSLKAAIVRSVKANAIKRTVPDRETADQTVTAVAGGLPPKSAHRPSVLAGDQDAR